MYTPVISVEPELGLEYVRAVLQDVEITAGEIAFEQYHLFIEYLAGAAEENPEDQAKLQQADAVILLVHFMDASNLLVLRGVYQRVMATRNVPTGVFIFRPHTERQFKISCTECGQKLWILEQDIGMRGRCINCRRPMLIPTPSEYLRAQLMLPDSVPVLNVIRGDTSLCRGALANLLARTGPGIFGGAGGNPQDFLKKATVPIQIDTRALAMDD